MNLHDELHRIADRAPVADVPDDTWTRARHARTRDLALTVAAVAAVVAVVAGAVAWLPTTDALQPADTDSLGVPDRLYPVPERMSDREDDGSWMRDEVTNDPTGVGVGAAAWVTPQGLPVVVDAESGDYHLLDLPDFVGNSWASAEGLGHPTVALSPDGRDLAYSYAVFGPDAATEPIPSGVRVVDLTTGTRREIPVPGKEGTAVSQIEWSPDGSWLAFTGRQQDTWTTQSMGGRGPAVIGRVPPGATRAETRAVGNEQVPLSVDDRGTVQWRNGKVRVWGAGPTDPRDLEALGRLSDGSLLVRTGSVRNDVVAVADADTDTLRRVMDLAGIDVYVSVATDLMPPDQPTVTRPEPDWPWSEELISIAIGLGVAAAIAAGLGLRWLVRRRVR